MSVTEHSRLEDMLKSPDGQPHFQRHHKSMVPKYVGTELFGVSSAVNDSYNKKFHERKKETGGDSVCLCVSGGGGSRMSIPLTRYLSTYWC
jgi:hypothetical protein